MVPVPAGVLAAVRGYTSDVLDCPPERVAAASRFEDGNRHAVYKVSYVDADGNADNVVLRVSLSADTTELVQAQREASVLGVVGGRAGPALLDFRATSAWFDAPTIMMCFVSGRQFDLRTANVAEIEQIGSLVARVHGQPTDDLTPLRSTTGDIATYADDRRNAILAGLVWAREPVAPGVAARVQRAGDVIDRSWHEVWRDHPCFGSTGTLALLHGDIAFGNVLWDNEPVLIDWEYARLGDPADEIAYVFDQNGLSDQQRDAFWRGYRRSSDTAQPDDIVKRVTWWERLTLLGSTLWWLERWIRRTNAETSSTVDATVEREATYYMVNVNTRLNRLDALID
jgi:Ser/Thr protein kinase RdoA (MazF antagonist)